MVKKGKIRTPSGKIEIYSKTLADNGYAPLPEPQDPLKVVFAEPEDAEKYPLWLSTGTRIIYFTHTQFRNLPSLRSKYPEPVAEINPETAKEYGLSDGDTALVETPKGQLKIKVKSTPELLPGVVLISHGWEETNVNVLTSCKPSDPVTGYPHLKALRCRIRKA
jgi:anaerobic selenocysteine-containing dehydrogenase